MLTEIIQLSFDKIMQTRAYTVIVLSAQGKKFAIYTEPSIGKILQDHLTGTKKGRPMTHDLIMNVLKGANVRIRQVVINDVQETTYFARLFLEYDADDLQHIIEIDSRPSDCITLALINNVPVYCTQEVLEKSLTIDE